MLTSCSSNFGALSKPEPIATVRSRCARSSKPWGSCDSNADDCAYPFGANRVQMSRRPWTCCRSLNGISQLKATHGHLACGRLVGGWGGSRCGQRACGGAPAGVYPPPPGGGHAKSMNESTLGSASPLPSTLRKPVSSPTPLKVASVGNASSCAGTAAASAC
jgi:hypothetical protein